MVAHNKPFHTLRNGGMKVAIRHNDGIKGPFFSTTFSRSFKDRTGAIAILDEHRRHLS